MLQGAALRLRSKEKLLPRDTVDCYCTTQLQQTDRGCSQQVGNIVVDGDLQNFP